MNERSNLSFTASNAEEPDPERKVRYADLATELDQIRRQGYAVSYNKVNPGGGMIAMLLPSADRDQPLAVGIGGVSAILEANLDRYLAALRQAIAGHCTFRGQCGGALLADPRAKIANERSLLHTGIPGLTLVPHSGPPTHSKEQAVLFFKKSPWPYFPSTYSRKVR